MAKVQHAWATFWRRKVYRRYADGFVEPADEDDVHEALKANSAVVTRRVVVELGLLEDGKFKRLKKKDVVGLGCRGQPIKQEKATRG